MCEVCSKCDRPGWRVPLRLSASNEPICILCHGVRGWNDLRPVDALPEFEPGIVATWAKTLTDRRAA